MHKKAKQHIKVCSKPHAATVTYCLYLCSLISVSSGRNSETFSMLKHDLRMTTTTCLTKYYTKHSVQNKMRKL